MKGTGVGVYLGAPSSSIHQLWGPDRSPRHVRASVSQFASAQKELDCNTSPGLSSSRLGSEHTAGASSHDYAGGPRTPEPGPLGSLQSMARQPRDSETAQARRPAQPGGLHGEQRSPRARSALFRSEPARRSKSANAAMLKTGVFRRRRGLWGPASPGMPGTAVHRPASPASAVCGFRLLSCLQVPAEEHVRLAVSLQPFVFFQMRMSGFSWVGPVHTSHPSSLK